MANPITWKNVGMPSFSGANYLAANAGQTITGGMDRLAQVAGSIEAQRAKEFQATKDAATNQFLTQIQDFNQPGQLAGFEQQLRTQLGGMGAGEVDAAKVNAALQGRLGQRANNLITSGQFDEAEQFIGQVGINDKSGLNTNLASGRQAQADAQAAAKLKQDKERAIGLYNAALNGSKNRYEVQGKVTRALEKANISAPVAKEYIGRSVDDFDKLNTLSTEDEAGYSRVADNLKTVATREIETLQSDPAAIKARTAQEEWDGYALDDSGTQYGSFETYAQMDQAKGDSWGRFFTDEVSEGSVMIQETLNELAQGRGPGKDGSSKALWKKIGTAIADGSIPESYIESAKIKAYNKSRESDPGDVDMNRFKLNFQDQLRELGLKWQQYNAGNTVRKNNEAKIREREARLFEDLEYARKATRDNASAHRLASFR
ncbi:hypothetical protein IT774_07705 [Salinimonas marina]|uniref:Uncharacterized protein n=1 Tax=Salinimonas marina TaxID=2785918 RepID=A0A7S9HE93_9ALTE|nr:hypothetical protein [Salinimonas marina]QPG06980.1 hypothetical protein IT774_07705 [Salinimonas marina]